jgi:HNH endonuclease
VLTGNTTYQVAHIYPYSLLDQSSAKEIKFWHILEGFWSEERIQRWREKIFPDQNRPDQGSETCQNLICLSYDAHAYWGRAYFALKPIQLSDDEKTLDVEFHWLPQRGYSAEVDVTTSPTSSKVSDISAGTKLFHFPTEQEIHSGRKISLTTDDPVERPLPSFGLLEMQWILHRLVAMSGAAEINDDLDNDDDDAMALRDEWLQRQADEWHSSQADGRHPYQDDGSDSS